MATIGGVRRLALSLPRTEEALVRDRVKFRVGRIVYLAFSRDEAVMGFAFPKEERESLVSSRPSTFQMPPPSDLRYNWVDVRLGAIDDIEMQEIVIDAWRMVVPKRVAIAHLGDRGRPRSPAPTQRISNPILTLSTSSRVYRTSTVRASPRTQSWRTSRSSIGRLGASWTTRPDRERW
jgi:hypothetical protein